MPSFNVVNYSVRPNKCIQRSLVFEGYQVLHSHLGLGKVNYIGLGSIWFSDFLVAHKILHIDGMVSIENSDVGYQRAKFNKPFKTVEVVNEMSTTALKALCANDKFNAHPWFVWLDYDGSFDETVAEDIRLVVENAPINTALVVTFNANPKNYGKPNQRAGRLHNLFGEVVPDSLSKEDCGGEKFPQLLARFTIDSMLSAAASVRRPGGFLPCFRIIYRDGADMVTVGGILPATSALPAIRKTIKKKSWPSCPDIAVATPPLTIREISLLQAQLPRSRRLTRASIRRLGFDLEEGQVEAYEKFYKYYPMYAQIAT